MQRYRHLVRCFAFLLAALFVSTMPALADRGGGGGSHGGGGFHSGGFHNGGFHHDGFHHGFHHGFHGTFFVGGVFNPFFWGWPYYGYPYYGYPYYGYPYPPPYPYPGDGYAPAAAPVAAAGTPPPPPPSEQSSWYYCAPTKSFYPYVTSCSQPWRQVPITPPH